MNKVSEWIIRQLSPKPGPGQVLILPYLTKDKTGIPNPRRVKSPDGADAVPPVSAPLPGQIPLDAALQSDGTNGNLQGNLTTSDIDSLWEKEK